MAQIFLSHTSFDADLALYLKRELENIFEGIKVFVSSDPIDLPPGVQWPKEVQDALKDARILLILATTRSLARPWVWFEAGTFWFSGRRIIPICLGRIRKHGLPSPLRDLQAVEGSNLEELRQLLGSVGQVLGLTAAFEATEELSKNLCNLDAKADTRSAQEIGGWLGVVWQGKFLAYDGPLEGLKLIEDEVFQQNMADALSAVDYKCHLGTSNRFSAHFDKGFRIIYLTDRKSWRRKISQNELVLLARPIGLDRME